MHFSEPNGPLETTLILTQLKSHSTGATTLILTQHQLWMAGC